MRGALHHQPAGYLGGGQPQQQHGGGDCQPIGQVGDVERAGINLKYRDGILKCKTVGGGRDDGGSGYHLFSINTPGYLRRRKAWLGPAGHIEEGAQLVGGGQA